MICIKTVEKLDPDSFYKVEEVEGWRWEDWVSYFLLELYITTYLATAK
jgi:hypothetical protein